MNVTITDRRSITAAKVLTAGLFLIIYLFISISLLMSPRVRGAGQHENDLYFQADSEFFAKRVAKDRHTYDRIRFHPLFVLFFNPVGKSMNTLTRNPEVSACILNALAGAIGVYLALTLFYDVLKYPALRAVLYTIIFGLTSTHLIFSIVPDTFIFSSVGLTALLIVALRYTSSLAAWVGVSLFCIGVMISNVVPAFLAAFFFLFRGDQRIKKTSDLFNPYFIGVVSVSAILSIIQKVWYNVWIFTDWRKIPKEDLDWYLYLPTDWAENWERLGLLMKHLWLFCVVPPQLKVTIHFLNPELTMATFMETSWWDFPIASWPAVLLWGILLALAAYFFTRQRLYRHPLARLLLLSLAFNLILYFFYGDDFMLFACNWLIFLLLLVFFTLERSSLVRNYTHQYQVGLAVFAVSLLIASGWLTYDLYNILLIQ